MNSAVALLEKAFQRGLQVETRQAPGVRHVLSKGGGAGKSARVTRLAECRYSGDNPCYPGSREQSSSLARVVLASTGGTRSCSGPG